MKRPLFHAAFVLALIAVASFFADQLSAQSVSEATPDRPDIPQKAEAKKRLIDIKLTQLSPKTVLSCPIRITITNVSEYGMMFTEVGSLLVCHLTITDAQGKPCPMNEKGYHTYCLDGEAYPRYSTQIARVEKGQKKDWDIDIAPFFPLKPGKWTVKVEMKEFGLAEDIPGMTPRIYQERYVLNPEATLPIELALY